MTCHPHYLQEIEGLPVFTQESPPSRNFGELVCGIFALDGHDWSNGLRYHNFDTKPDTEFERQSMRGEQYLPGPLPATSSTRILNPRFSESNDIL